MPEDAKGIANVQLRTWRTAYGSFVDPEYLANLSEDAFAQFQLEQISNEVLGRFVATDQNDHVIGYAVYGLLEGDPLPGEWFLYALYVLIEYQGLGIGHELLNQVRKSGMDAGYSRLGFGVFAENKSAISFYLRQGAEFVKTNDYELGGKKYPTDYYYLATKLDNER